MKRATVATVIGVFVVISGILLGVEVVRWLDAPDVKDDGSLSSYHTDDDIVTSRPVTLPSSRPNGRCGKDVVCSIPASGPSSVPSGPVKVDRGFVFVDGEYLDAPYIVSMDPAALTVTINGRVVRKSEVIPSREILKELPQPPAWLRKDTSLEDLLRWKDRRNPSFLIHAWEHLAATHDRAAAAEAMLAYLRSLACIKEVTLRDLAATSPGVIIDIVNYRDEKIAMFLDVVPPRGRSAEEVVASLHDGKEHYEIVLSSGACMFEGYGVTIGRLAVAQKMGVVVQVLRSNRSEAEKMELLGRTGLFSSEMVQSKLVRQFKASPQLEERIRQTVMETGVVPMTMADLEAAGSSD